MCVVFCCAVSIRVVLLLMPFVFFFYRRSRFVPVERAQYFPTNSPVFSPRLFSDPPAGAGDILPPTQREEDCERVGSCNV